MDNIVKTAKGAVVLFVNTVDNTTPNAINVTAQVIGGNGPNQNIVFIISIISIPCPSVYGSLMFPS